MSELAQDQKHASKQENQDAERFHEGTSNSHQANDSKDSRSIANKLAAAEHEEAKDDPKSREKKLLDQDATLPAKAHGNKPSRGAEIDQEIREEEEAILQKKGVKRASATPKANTKYAAVPNR
ncbi:hypothetical protein BT63DRAFT_477271 [Microthyrium microscopicum]|uniref:Uncharacterized protein n=1 Tax=Microthyrium microscopicum TaxID=703497 RepID=A0A6A6UJU1_9PEZI|nr:hypothetical protein BT63DRAFT_477271 [Microthyrium microscopicum]